nr:Gfo/Idh/MocA family oxidoreductase [uncultured Sphaerochaeta sp.]
MRYALIGCGRIAYNHLPSALAVGMEVVALCDINSQAIDALLSGLELQDLPIERYQDYRKMLDSCNLDMVAIATDSGSHAEIALECLARGINVLVEKPMALSLSDADNMLEMAKKQQVMLSVCQQNRFNDASQIIRSALDVKSFGSLSHISVQVRWARDRSYYQQANWRGTWEKDGGALMNQCIHGLDLMRWFAGGKIDRVYGRLANRYHPYLEVEDLGIGYIEFSNGVIGSFEGTTNVFEKDLEERLMIIGERGTAALGGEYGQHIEAWNFSDSKIQKLGGLRQEEPFSSIYGTSHQRVYEDCKRSIEEHRRPYVSAQDGRDALELVLAIYKSHLDKAPVSLPLTDFSTKDMHL